MNKEDNKFFRSEFIKDYNMNYNDCGLINMMNNHYNNIVKNTNKGIEDNMNYNCDSLLEGYNYNSETKKEKKKKC